MSSQYRAQNVIGSPLAFELGRMAFGLVTGELLRTLLLRSGKGAKKPNQEPEIEGEYPMSYYDDDLGAIGYELIGQDDDSAILDALAISGQELIGNNLLIGGDGSSDIIGAASPQQQAAIRKLAMRNAGAVVNRGLDRRRRYPLGFVPTAVAAGVSAQIPAAPQNLFRPERLVIPSDISFDTGVRDVKVGNQSQLVQSVEVPAALFSEVAINTGVTFDTAEVGNQISVDIRNKSAVAYEFSAGLVGTIAK